MTSHEHENQRPETVIWEINRTSLFADCSRDKSGTTAHEAAESQAAVRGNRGKRGEERGERGSPLFEDRDFSLRYRSLSGS